MVGPVLGVGDIIAISGLICRIVSELNRSSAASAEYQDIFNELKSLECVLKDVQNITPGLYNLDQLNGIRALAATCQHPLEVFLERISKFEDHLGAWSAGSNRFKGFGSRVKWTSLYKNDVAELRLKLAPKLTAISILLLTQQANSQKQADSDRHHAAKVNASRSSVQQILLASIEQSVKSGSRIQSKVAASQESLKATATTHLSTTFELHMKADILLDQSTTATELLRQQTVALSSIQTSIDANGKRLDSTNSMLQSVQDEVIEVKKAAKPILGLAIEAVALVTAGLSTIQDLSRLVCSLVVLAGNLTIEMRHAIGVHLQSFWEIQRKLSIIEKYLPRQIDLPVIRFRDAFNVIRAFPYDLSREWRTFKSLVAVAFANQQGLRRVNMGLFFITHARIGTRLSPQFWRNAIEPGDELSMTMIIDEYKAEEGFCPWKSCRASTREVEITRGGKFCPKCHKHAAVSKEERADSIRNNNEVEDREQDPETRGPKKSSISRVSHRVEEEAPDWSEDVPLVTAPEFEDSEDEDIELYFSIQVGILVPPPPQTLPASLASTSYYYGVPPQDHHRFFDDASTHPYYSEERVYYAPQQSDSTPRRHSRKPVYSPSSQFITRSRYESSIYVDDFYQKYSSEHVYVASTRSKPWTTKRAPKDLKGSRSNAYYSFNQEQIYDEQPNRSRRRRPASTKSGAKSDTKYLPTRTPATEEDAVAAGIPAGYSLKNWDPSEKPIILLGSVFDANSMGKWIYDWTVHHHTASTSIADVAGDLWLLLIKLAGKIKRAEAFIGRMKETDCQEMVEDFIESGSRLWQKFKKLLKKCEMYMWKAAKRDSGKGVSMGKHAGHEFVDSIFGRDRELENAEKLMNSIRLWNMRFDVNCEDILRRPSAISSRVTAASSSTVPEETESATGDVEFATTSQGAAAVKAASG